MEGREPDQANVAKLGAAIKTFEFRRLIYRALLAMPGDQMVTSLADS